LAGEALKAFAERGAWASPSSPAGRRALAEHLRSINNCPDCHVADRPPREHASDPGVVNRGTDGDGFYQPSTVFDDRSPLETYRPRNANLGDPFIRYVCGPTEAAAGVSVSAGVHCAGGEVPIAVLDLRDALDAGDAHARGVCASRRYLYGHLDDDGRRLLATSMEDCLERKSAGP